MEAGGAEVVIAIASAAGGWLGKVWAERRRAKREAERRAQAGEQYEDAEDRRWREEYRCELDRQRTTIERLMASEQRAWDRAREMQELASREYASGGVVAARVRDLEEALENVRGERDVLLERLPREKGENERRD